MKFSLKNNKYNIITVFFVLAVFISSAVFSIFIGMQADEHGNMSNCLFSAGKTSLCPMSTLEHLREWQQFLVAAFSTNNVYLIISFILLLLIFSNALDLFFYKKLPGFFYLKLKQKTNLFNYLIKYFSQGVLSPKIYELAII